MSSNLTYGLDLTAFPPLSPQTEAILLRDLVPRLGCLARPANPRAAANRCAAPN